MRRSVGRCSVAILKKDAKSGAGSRPAPPPSLSLLRNSHCLLACLLLVLLLLPSLPFRGRFQEDTWAEADGDGGDDGGGQRENFLQFASLCMTGAAFVHERGDEWIRPGRRAQQFLMTKTRLARTEILPLSTEQRGVHCPKMLGNESPYLSLFQHC